jgi:uncharacterized membrane-anchored protein YhcB (DUF1043 family)
LAVDGWQLAGERFNQASYRPTNGIGEIEWLRSRFGEGARQHQGLLRHQLPTANCQLEEEMDDIEKNNDAEFEDDDEQIEQMIIENGILLHSLATLLVRKGILKQEEIDAEMDRLYDEMENFEQQ